MWEQPAGLEPEDSPPHFLELEINLRKQRPVILLVFIYQEKRSRLTFGVTGERWQRQRQFIGSEPFWQLLATLFQASWAFRRDPVLPPAVCGTCGNLLRQSVLVR